MEDGKGLRNKSVPDGDELRKAVSAVTESRNQAAQERAASAEADETKKPRKSRLPVLLALVVISGGVLVATRLATAPVLPVSPEDSAKETIYVTVLALTAELEETGAYPESLEDIGMDQEGLTYSRGSDGYSLTAEEDGSTVEYNSGEDLTAFRDAFEALLIPGGGG